MSELTFTTVDVPATLTTATTSPYDAALTASRDESKAKAFTFSTKGMEPDKIKGRCNGYRAAIGSAARRLFDGQGLTAKVRFSDADSHGNVTVTFWVATANKPRTPKTDK